MTRRGGRGCGGAASQCDCDPLFERICDRIRQDRRTIVSHIQQSNTRLSSRLESLERRTRQEVRLSEEKMKESFAEERTACQDRLERRAVRERLEASHRQHSRDLTLQQEISGWLQVPPHHTTPHYTTLHKAIKRKINLMMAFATGHWPYYITFAVPWQFL